jgi:hypothetical protein
MHWGPKTTRAIFDDAVRSTGFAADDCVFVGEDPEERLRAHEAGMRTAAHPVFCLAAVEGRLVLWVSIELPAGRNLAELETIVNTNEVVPVHVTSDRRVLAMATARGVNALEQGGFTVTSQDEVGATSAYLIRDDRQGPAPAPGTADPAEDEASRRAEAAFAFISGELTGMTSAVTYLGPAPGGVYIAAAAGTPIEALHIPGSRHGHTELLLPDPALLSRPGEAHADGFVSGFTAGAPSPETIQAVCSAITPGTIRGHAARISGADPLVEGEPLTIGSRYVSRADNMLVVDALARRLHELGLTVRRHEFSWQGHPLANIEAEYHVETSDATVLITAHLDSTAALGEYVDADGRPRAYDPAIDPAPGADDDGSGVAAVMAAAECLRTITTRGRTPARTLRFVLFNAEEQGLVGSKVYARAAAAAGERIAAVLQMDMIAGIQGDARKMEVHAGTRVLSPATEASAALGGLVAQNAATITPDFEVEKLTGTTDPAAGRSDHASFHERGWAAVAVSENLFPDTAPATGTRQYHKPGDTITDRDYSTDYAAGIARAVTASALALAGL